MAKPSFGSHGPGRLPDAEMVKLKKPSLERLSLSNETSDWVMNGRHSVFYQNRLEGTFSLQAIPVRFQILHTGYNNSPGPHRKLTYQISYDRSGLLKKYRFDESILKGQWQQHLDFSTVTDAQAFIQQSYKSLPAVQELLQKTGCSFNELLQLSDAAFLEKYGEGILQEKLNDAEILKRHYADYIQTHANVDSLIYKRQQAADSQFLKLQASREHLRKLATARNRMQETIQKLKTLQEVYEARLAKVINSWDLVQKAANANDLKGLTMFMTRVRSIQLGQHSVTAGQLVLRNYVHNGFSFQYETKKNFIFLTYGTQERIPYTNGFMQNLSQGGVSEYYSYQRRYRLAGISIKRKGEHFSQQISWLNFSSIADSIHPVITQRKMDVLTVAHEWKIAGSLLDYAVSKSIPRNTLSSGQTGHALWEALAFEVSFQHQQPYSANRKKLQLVYNSPLYYNPGLYGGQNRPGLTFHFDLDQQLSEHTRLKEKISLYTLNYGNGYALKNIRNRIDLSRKFGKLRLGLLNQSGHSIQTASDPKSSLNSTSADLLATMQYYRRDGEWLWNVRFGAGYGFFHQQQYNRSYNYSYFINFGGSIGKWSIEANLDQFNTRNTEIYLVDSNALFFTSSFQLDALLAYATDNGNCLQSGLQYRKLDSEGYMLLLTGSADVKLLKRITIQGKLNLPIRQVVPPQFINQVFNTRILFNLKGHDQ